MQQMLIEPDRTDKSILMKFILYYFLYIYFIFPTRFKLCKSRDHAFYFFYFFMVFSTEFYMMKKSLMIFANYLVYSLGTTNLV